MNKFRDMSNRSIGKEIGILSRAAHTFFQHQFKNYSIGHAQVMTLHFICRNNGRSQHELVKYFNLDKSSVTSQLNILEKNGYIIRKIDTNDSRGRMIFITEKTKAIEADLYDKFISWSKILLEGFNAEEQEKVFCLLDKMNTNAQRTIVLMKKNDEKK
jgi:DNA-binding MarR family transcriptional regulator